jgi:hypothetical protein
MLCKELDVNWPQLKLVSEWRSNTEFKQGAYRAVEKAE